MNWKSEAMEKLRNYDAMVSSLMNIPKEIERLKIAATGIRSARVDGDPVRGGGNRREEILMDNMMRRQELQWKLEQAKHWVACTEKALEALTPEETLVLRRMYIYPEKGCLERLCGELGVEQSSIYRKRDKALYRFTLALYGGTES